MDLFFDLHCHMLCGVDDGAEDHAMMFDMLETAYADGIRALCLTPHYTPYLYGDTFEESSTAFHDLEAYTAKKHPDLRLYLGHELGYYDGCLSALESGRCRTLAGSRYVLVDFPEKIGFFDLENAIRRLSSVGLRPILAHTERYTCLARQFGWIRLFVENGGVVQINASSVRGDWGFGAKARWKKLVRERLAHVISTDAHDLDLRPPKMSVCMDYLRKHCPKGYIDCLIRENAERIVTNRDLQ